MLTFIINNIGTIIAGALVLVAIFFAIKTMGKDKKAGKTICGCGSGCAGCAGCSDKKNPTKATT